MPTYYYELNGGRIQTTAKFSGGEVYVVPSGGGGGGTMQSKSVSYTPSETAISATVSPDYGYDGLSSVSVSVGAISSSYVGSDISRRDSTDLSVSGGTVTVPAGYYASSASTAVAPGSATTPATTITANPTISISGNSVSASVSKTQSITPTVSAGYVASGTAGTITVSGSGSATIPSASQSLTDAYMQLNGDLEVELNTGTAGYVSSGNQYLQFANFATPQSAQTIHPSTSDQTIPADTYTLGAQTIKGVLLTNLSAGNIKKDVVVEVGDSADPDRIVSVTGTYEGGGGGLDVNAVAMRTAPSGALVLDTATEIAAYAFYRGKMTSVVSSSVAMLRDCCFQASDVTSASFPNVTQTEGGMFKNCKGLTLTLPKVTSMGTYLFQYCSSGDYVIDIGENFSAFTSTTFYGTDNMSTCIMILRKTDGVVSAPGMDGIPKPLWNANKTGTLYVPQALLASYQTASNWSTAYGTANTTFVAIEGSAYENYYADGTPIS